MRKIVAIENLLTFYKIEGEGEVVLLLHGWGGNLDSFDPLFLTLKRRYKVVALSFWGMGESHPPFKPWDLEEYAKAVLKFCQATKIEKAFVVAHSFGGRVALKINQLNPDFIEKFVLCDCAGLKPKFSLSKWTKVFCFKLLKLAVKWKVCNLSVLRNKGSADFRQLSPVMKQTFVKIVNEDLSSCAKKICKPTLILWGESDTATPFWMGKKLNKLILDSKLVSFPNAGHFVYLECFDACDKEIKSFFEEKK